MISKVVVANRGEIVVRIARTAREMGLATVAVYSEPDRDAPHVAACDEAVALGGATPAESYLRGDTIIAAAQRVGADAIHPGFGFLAENADFARAVVDAGLVWVGPHAEAIAAMGDKLEAKRLMAEAGVPLLASVEIDEHTDLDAAADEVGLPLMVKATAGGGGKGMRIVADAGALADEVAAARREAGGAFGDDRVFVERYLTRPRHVEVQIVGDHHGVVVHLFERECSVQRRHQKVVEETPSVALTPQLRKEMGEAAVAAARAIGYDNAGTVEFIVGEDGSFHFLEMNTRLQVEHPVTEEVVRVRGPAPPPVDDSAGRAVDGSAEPRGASPAPPPVDNSAGRAVDGSAEPRGASPAPPPVDNWAGRAVDGSAEPPGVGSVEARIDLVRLQLEVAAGQRLAFTQDDLVQRGHAIEVRLYAEDPAADYLPSTGTLHRFTPERAPGVRWDVGVATGTEISPHYDPMLGKVIAWAPTRAEAGRRLARALERTTVHGVTTNRELLAAILRDEAFLAGDTTTAFLDERFPEPSDRTFPPADTDVDDAAVVAALDGERRRRSQATAQATIPSGWRNNRSHDQRIRYRHGEREITVHYRLERDHTWTVTVDETHRRRAVRCGDTLEVDGRRLPIDVCYATDPVRARDEVHVRLPTAQLTLVEVARFPRVGLAEDPGATLAPMPGAVVALAVSEGEEVSAGQLLVTVEAMKMEHRITAPHDGVVAEVHVTEGEQVDAGEVLVVVEEAEG